MNLLRACWRLLLPSWFRLENDLREDAKVRAAILRRYRDGLADQPAGFRLPAGV